MLKLEPVTYQSLPLAIDEDLEFRWQYTSQKQWSPTFYLKIKSRTPVKSRVPLIGDFLPFFGQ